jgi:UPF0271 protein
MGYNPLSVSEEQFTASSIIKELHPDTTPYFRLKLALETQKLRIHIPSTTSTKDVEETARKVGDLRVLSEADKDVLAIALDLSRNGYSPQLVSDDYAIQNIAELLGLKYVSLTTHGIRYRFKWTLYCPACKRIYASDTEKVVCVICGTRLKRKVLRKRAIERRKP